MYLRECLIQAKNKYDSNLEVLSISKKEGLVLQSQKFKKEIASKDKSKYKVVMRGQLVISIHIDEGVVAILKNIEKGIVSPAYKIFDINAKYMNHDYLILLLKSKKFLNEYAKIGNSSVVGRSNFNINKFLNMSFEIPNTNVQKNIVEKVEKIKQQILLCEEKIEQLNVLVKSRFIEMFNDKCYPIIPLKKLSVSKAEYGAGSASIPYEYGRPRYVRITDINDDGTLNNDAVSSINVQDDIDYKLSYGDFMFARMGATVGKTYAYYSGNEIYAGYLIRYKLDLNKLNPRYLFTYSKLDEYGVWVKNNQSGVAQPGINAKKYDMLPIPVPPIELQNEFASFVKLIDKSKYIITNSSKVSVKF